MIGAQVFCTGRSVRVLDGHMLVVYFVKHCESLACLRLVANGCQSSSFSRHFVFPPMEIILGKSSVSVASVMKEE